MYARLRGVSKDNIKTCVNSLIDVLLLRPHADKLTSDYRYILTPSLPWSQSLFAFLCAGENFDFSGVFTNI
jgi:hypothetical protein